MSAGSGLSLLVWRLLPSPRPTLELLAGLALQLLATLLVMAGVGKLAGLLVARLRFRLACGRLLTRLARVPPGPQATVDQDHTGALRAGRSR